MNITPTLNSDYKMFVLRPHQIGSWSCEIQVYAWVKPPSEPYRTETFWTTGTLIACTHNSAKARAVLPQTATPNKVLGTLLGLPADCEFWHVSNSIQPEEPKANTRTLVFITAEQHGQMLDAFADAIKTAGISDFGVVMVLSSLMYGTCRLCPEVQPLARLMLQKLLEQLNIS